VSPQLKGYDLGSSDSEATHALILDQEEQMLFMSKEEYNALVMKVLKNLTYARDVSMDEIQRRMKEQHALIKKWNSGLTNS
jgi:hypothetical protein